MDLLIWQLVPQSKHFRCSLTIPLENVSFTRIMKKALRETQILRALWL